MIPILFAHQADKPIGKAEPDPEGGLRITMLEGQELEQKVLFSAFGDCGFEVIQFVQPPEGEPRIRIFRIREWSVTSPA